MKITKITIFLILMLFFVNCSDDENNSNNDESSTTDDTNTYDTGLEYKFEYGVASGDPLSDRVIIWTRLTPPDETLTQDFNVNWEVSTNIDFTNIVKSGSAITNKNIDFTVKIDVEGLSENTKYFYRFFIINTQNVTFTSVIGQTKTLAKSSSSIENLKLAVVSGQDFQQGYFYVYREINKLKNLDAILHLGDYIFEFNASEFAGFDSKLWQPVAKRVETLEPKTELITIDDYRKRYATYRTDSDLKEAHRLHPFIHIWDDHEISKIDSRKDISIQAFYEWLPIREKNDSEKNQIFRDFYFGDLAHLNLVDVQNLDRDNQISKTESDSYLNSLNLIGYENYISNRPISMLGDLQKFWLESSIKSSNTIWEIIGNSSIFGELKMPVGVIFSFDPVNSPVEYQLPIDLYIGNLVTESTSIQMTPVSYFMDTWDGYQMDRDYILDITEANNKNLILLSGNQKTTALHELKNENNRTLGVAVTTPSTTSAGLEVDFGLYDSALTFNEFMFLASNKNSLKHINLQNRGFTLLNFSRDDVSIDMIYLDSVKNSDYSVLNGFSSTNKNKSFNLKLDNGTKPQFNSTFSVVNISETTVSFIGFQSNIKISNNSYLNGTDSIALKTLDINAINSINFAFRGDADFNYSSSSKSSYFKLSTDSETAILQIFYQEHFENETFEIEFNGNGVIYQGELKETTIGSPILLQEKTVESSNDSEKTLTLSLQ
jgi:alkaline phosphatase D